VWHSRIICSKHTSLDKRARIPAKLLCGKANPMAKRKLRIVRDHPLLAICEYCNMEFSCGLMPIEQAKDDIQERFNVHKCKLQDFTQNAARIVREATEDQ